MISPWHQTVWRSLQERCELLPSTMLLVGRPGTDLANFGMELAGMLLCDAAKGERPCAVCNSCHLFAQGFHPDLHVISTEEEEEETNDPRFKNQSIRYTNLDSAKRERRSSLRSIITVDQIREVTDALDKSAGIGSSKICLIHPAEVLNLNAANALLKSLEEPTDGTHFLLLSSFPGSLPPTIRSRCSRVNLNNPTNDDSIEWLTNVHKVDLRVAEQLIAQGFGPYEVLQINTKENLEAYRTLLEGLTDLISMNKNPGSFTRQIADCNLGLTLKVIQSEIYRGLKGSVQSDHDNEAPIVISPDQALEFRDVLFSVYFSIGRFLELPKKSVDERLFLEQIAYKLSLTPKHGLSS